MWSTPFLICSRIALTKPYGPSHSSAWPVVRKWPPVVVRKWPHAIQARADELAGIERALPRDVHEAVRAGAAKADDARLGERGHQPVAEERDLVGERRVGEREVVGMDVHVPQAGHADTRRARSMTSASPVAARSAAGQDLARCGRPRSATLASGHGRRADAVDQRRVGEQRARHAPTHSGMMPILRRAPSTCRFGSDELAECFGARCRRLDAAVGEGLASAPATARRRRPPH